MNLKGLCGCYIIPFNIRDIANKLEDLRVLWPLSRRSETHKLIVHRLSTCINGCLTAIDEDEIHTDDLELHVKALSAVADAAKLEVSKEDLRILQDINLLADRTQGLITELKNKNQPGFGKPVASMKMTSENLDEREALAQLRQRYEQSLADAEGRSREKDLELGKIIEGLRGEVAETTNFMKTAGNQLKAELAGLKVPMQELAGHRTSQYFDAEALTEKDQAKYFRWGAIGCMATVAIISFIGFFLHLYNVRTHLDALDSAPTGVALKVAVSASVGWSGVQSSLSYWAAVFPVTIFLSLLAAYLARESTWHKNQASKLRRIAMNISTLEPFIGSLDPVKQNEITAKVAESVFITTDTLTQERDTFPINHQELMIALINKLDLGKKSGDDGDKKDKPANGKS